MESYFGDTWLVRLLFQRALAAIYLIAFLVTLQQFKALLGERGLLPIRNFMAQVNFWQAPSLFYWRYSDRLLNAVAWTGIALSAIALAGLLEIGPLWLSVSIWLLLWVLYLSIVNVGQNFYSFGWESMLLEAGFFASFMGTARISSSFIPALILRWMLFRTELGAGLIKLRHDRCWRELTCLFFHYETQPLPNPLSWHFHRLPRFMHRFSVLFSHFVQVLVPFGLFAPQPFASVAGALIIFHQLWLIVSGNYSWLNWLTVALGITAFSDSILAFIVPVSIPQTLPLPLFFRMVLYVIAAGTVLLSIQPALNMISRNQVMNYTYNRFHLVNTYGAFGRVTKKRYEIIIEGADDPFITAQTRWQEYGFKAKPGDPACMPPQIAPWHLRLDWLMWFLPFSVLVGDSAIYVSRYQRWFLNLIGKLLEGDARTLKLLRDNPFVGHAPRFIRALFYEYRYTTWQEKRETGNWWKRRQIGVYLDPISLAQIRRLVNPERSEGTL